MRVAGQRRLRARREPRHRRDARAVVAVLNADLDVEPGTAGALVARSTRDAAARRGRPAVRNLDGTDYPSARAIAVDFRSRSGTALLGLWWPTNPFTTRTGSSTPTPDRARVRRLGLGRGRLAAPRRARRRRRLGRALLHVPGGRRPVLAAAARRLGRSRTNRPASSCTCRARARRAGRTGCSSSTTGRRGVSPAAGSPARAPLLLPFAAVYLAARGALAMAAHAWRRAEKRGTAPASLDAMGKASRTKRRASRPVRAQVPRQPRWYGAGGRRRRSRDWS